MKIIITVLVILLNLICEQVKAFQLTEVRAKPITMTLETTASTELYFVWYEQILGVFLQPNSQSMKLLRLGLSPNEFHDELSPEEPFIVVRGYDGRFYFEPIESPVDNISFTLLTPSYQWLFLENFEVNCDCGKGLSAFLFDEELILRFADGARQHYGEEVAQEYVRLWKEKQSPNSPRHPTFLLLKEWSFEVNPIEQEKHDASSLKNSSIASIANTPEPPPPPEGVPSCGNNTHSSMNSLKESR